MLTVLQALFLGIVQGLTEWLPVSSSGHLVIVQETLGIGTSLAFDVFLHLATLLVVVFIFRRDIYFVLRAAYKRDFHSEEGKLFIFLVVGTIPTALAGGAIYLLAGSLFTNLALVGGALLFTGAVLFISGRAENREALTKGKSVIVGIFQGIAVIPGISRSGLTISSGLLQGVRRETIIMFSFLLSVPAILGAMAFEARDLVLSGIEPLPLLAGFLASLVAGYISIKILIKLIMQRRFRHFSWYCWAVGIIVMALALT